MTRSRIRTMFVAFVSGCCLAVVMAGPASAQIALAGSTPEDGAALDVPVRTVRVWFDTAPRLDESTLEISGPGNRATIEGLHVMDENDLMGRVSGPMPDGEWRLTWTAAGADGEPQTGTITFTVKRAR
jgi:methionine-rich copper-binding protein CopC